MARGNAEASQKCREYGAAWAHALAAPIAALEVLLARKDIASGQERGLLEGTYARLVELQRLSLQGEVPGVQADTNRDGRPIEQPNVGRLESTPIY